MIGRRGWTALTAAMVAAKAAKAGPMRIVSVGGALTETIFALGRGSDVIAVDSTSQYPAAARQLPQVGYMRALPTEGIISLTPDLLLLSRDAGPASVVEVLRAARLPLAIVDDDAGPDAAPRKARAVAQALGIAGSTLADAIAADWQMLDAPLSGVRAQPRVLFVLSLARGAPLVSGRGTHADAMIRAAGGLNPVTGFEGYRPLSAEAAAGMAPDVILMMDHALAEAGGATAALQTPALAVTPSARQGRVISMDGSFLLNFGPRAAHARLALIRALHPQLALPELPDRAWTAA